MRKFSKVAAAGLLALTGMVSLNNTVSLQDISSLTNTRTAFENRWLAHLVELPKGSVHLNGAEPVNISTMGVKTAEALHVLDRTHMLETGEKFEINRTMKGGRVFVPKPKPKAEPILVGAKMLLQTDTLVVGSLTPSITESPSLIQMAANFSMPSPRPTVESTSTPRRALAKAHLDQARSAARQMAKVVEKVQREANQIAKAHSNDVPVVTAYAPQDVESTMASAFAAVLRPTILKEQAKKKKATPVIKAVARKRKKKSVKRASVSRRIKLAKGDHKWALNRLPLSSFSRTERRCLASGVYFEARSESRAGQQAVAQVILNRVKNPTYPNSICGVVYQNRWKRNACQFSFACDGIRDRVNSRKHWKKSLKVANDAIDGRVWLRSVGSSSHYHADYVWPKWRKKMRKMTKIGRHIFYRTYGGGWS